MATDKRQFWLQAVVQVPLEMKDPVHTALSHSLPLLHWESERKDSTLCLIRGAVLMNSQVDTIVLQIEKTLQRIEAKHELSDSLSVDLKVYEGNRPTGDGLKEPTGRKVSPRLVVSPPVGSIETDDGQEVLFIEPQEAFGDGNHPSTRLALRLLDELFSGKYGPCVMEKGWVLDAGCGTGVLALAASAFGGLKVLAVDIDPRAIDAARGNLKLNSEPGSRVFLTRGELSCARGPFCLVLANLVPPIHEKSYKILWNAAAPGGWLILSGFCQNHKNSILSNYVESGAEQKAYSVDNAWAGLLLHKPMSKKNDNGLRR